MCVYDWPKPLWVAVDFILPIGESLLNLCIEQRRERGSIIKIEMKPLKTCDCHKICGVGFGFVKGRGLLAPDCAKPSTGSARKLRACRFLEH